MSSCDAPARPAEAGPDGPARGRRRPLRGVPVVSSAVVAAVQLAGSTGAASRQGGRADLDALGYALLLLGPALLLLRRRLPGTVVHATALVCLGYLAGGYPYGPFVLSFLVAFASAAVRGDRRAAWSAAVLLYGGHLVIAHLLYRDLPPPGDGPAPWWPEWAVAAWLLAFGAAVQLARVRREGIERARRERAGAEARRAGEERLRIAREVHDVVAHSLSVITVQAGVGLELLDADPEQARAALTAVRDTGRQALGEVRQVLDALRDPGAAPRAPAPGLDRLPELVRHAGAAGLRVTTTSGGTARPLPPAADLAAFRVVQEALTNVVRHSAARAATVRLDHRPGLLHVRVDDDGPPLAPSAGPGNGLTGMRERAAALGGTVEAGPRPGGGFRVDAVLPLGDAP
jgi:signal transduction histidine kinase